MLAANDKARVLRALDQQRESVVPLGEGKTITIRRPRDGDPYDRLKPATLIGTLAEAVVDWSGWTEADVIEGGASDALPFDPEIFAAVLKDDDRLITKVSKALREAREAHDAKRAAATGNS